MEVGNIIRVKNTPWRGVIRALEGVPHINCYLNDRKKSPVNYTLLPNNERYLTQWNNRQE